MPVHREKNHGLRWGLAISLACLMASVAVPSSAGADIYKYVDEHGVIHFTNAPTSKRYTLFLPGLPQFDDYGTTDKFDYYIALASKMYDLSFPLLKAVIKVESNFNPRAISPKGAQGLMQIMPGTARLLDVSDPFDPMQNIMGGSRYLRMMVDRFDGSVRLALAGYNAGPNAVDQYKGIPPYRETQEYVERVLRHYQHIKGKGKE